jgi:hypothetical protein
MMDLTPSRGAGAVALALTLSACGGGGGVNSPGSTPAPPPPVANPVPTPSPAPTPAPSPTPAPAPTPSAELTASGAAVGMKAPSAYEKGLDGRGLTVAIIDTGIDTDGAEFAGRISADSTAFDQKIARCATCAPETVRLDLQGVVGHGTTTASIAAAARNGPGMHGVAYEATILALKISGVDLDGVTPTSPINESDSANTALIAPAISYAVDKGAFAISMSLNGSGAAFRSEQRAAMDKVRAENRLFIQSVSNFKGQDSFAGEIAENLVSTDLANKDWFLFGIRVNENLVAPMENGTPGLLADRTLAVVADGVQAIAKDGSVVTVTGNSFAAPAIAGAATLLKQYWPQLGGKEISRILLDTATDLGTPGVDQTYGVGLLNLEKALQAQAPTLGTTAKTSAAVAATSITFSDAFGGQDATGKWGQATGQAVVLDRYGRDYTVDVGALAGSRTQAGVSVLGAIQAQPTLFVQTPENHSAALVADRATGLQPRALAGQPVAFGFRMSADTAVAARIGGANERSTLVTGGMLRNLGLAAGGSEVTLFQGGYALSLSGSGRSDRMGRNATGGFTLTTPEGVTVGLSRSNERGSALGLRGTGAFQVDGATTTFATLGWSGEVGGLRLTGEAMAGRTRVRTASTMVQFAEPVLSGGFRLQADAAAFGGLATFGVTSPLRVERARLRYTAPVAFNLDTGELVNATGAV